MASTDTGLARDAPHLALRQVGQAGQARIRAARVLLVGVGGLGCAAAQYLASSGVQQLTLCDFDRVESSNLARQLLYTPADVGQAKVHVAAAALARLNPQIRILTRQERIDAETACELLREHDLAVDASDNYGTRLAMNTAALTTGKPWIMGACVRLEGQFVVFGGRPGAPCYRCLYGSAPETLEDCPGAGIFAPVAGIIGAAMAHAALLQLAGVQMAEGLHLLDAAEWSWRRVRFERRLDCPVCSDAGD